MWVACLLASWFFIGYLLCTHPRKTVHAKEGKLDNRSILQLCFWAFAGLHGSPKYLNMSAQWTHQQPHPLIVSLLEHVSHFRSAISVLISEIGGQPKQSSTPSTGNQ